MRKTTARNALAAALAVGVLTAGAAHAAPVAINDVTLSPSVQTKFDKVYGQREIAPLTKYAKHEIERALTNAGATVGGAGLRVETTLTSATANKPTFKQLSDTVGLDYIRSVSIGGSRLSAQFIDQNGAVVGEVEGGYYENDIRYVYATAPWADAERGIRAFAKQVGQKYSQLTLSSAGS